MHDTCTIIVIAHITWYMCSNYYDVLPLLYSIIAWSMCCHYYDMCSNYVISCIAWYMCFLLCSIYCMIHVLALLCSMYCMIYVLLLCCSMYDMITSSLSCGIYTDIPSHYNILLVSCVIYLSCCGIHHPTKLFLSLFIYFKLKFNPIFFLYSIHNLWVSVSKYWTNN